MVNKSVKRKIHYAMFDIALKATQILLWILFLVVLSIPMIIGVLTLVTPALIMGLCSMGDIPFIQWCGWLWIAVNIVLYLIALWLWTDVD